MYCAAALSCSFVDYQASFLRPVSACIATGSRMFDYTVFPSRNSILPSMDGRVVQEKCSEICDIMFPDGTEPVRATSFIERC